MCRTWSIGYSCKHYYTSRLSTCHGTFTVQPKLGKPHKSACSSAPAFVLKSNEACGDCQRKIAEQDLQASVAAARSAAGISGMKLAEAEQAYLDDCFKLQKTFPSCRRYQGSAKPGKGLARPTGRDRGSLLKREVLAEQVVERYEEHKTVIGGTWDQSTWGADYTSLSDELAEKAEEETPAMDLPMTGLMGESMDDYCKAFELGENLENDEEEGRSEAQGETGASWSAGWPSEPVEDQEWTSKESTHWSSEPLQEKEEKDAAMEATSSAPTALGIMEGSISQMNPADDPVGRAATISTPGKDNEVEQTFPMDHTDDAPTTPLTARPSSVSTRKLPTRGKKPAIHRRSTFDGGKMEMDLRDHFKCLRLANLISVGGD